MSAWSVYIYTFSFLLIKKSEEIKQQQQQLLPIHTYSFLFFFLSFFFGFFSVFFRWVSKVWQRAKKEEKEKSTNLLFYFTPRFLSLSFSPFLLFSLSLTRFPESHILHIHFSLSTGWMTAWFFLRTSTYILYIYIYILSHFNNKECFFQINVSWTTRNENFLFKLDRFAWIAQLNFRWR